MMFVISASNKNILWFFFFHNSVGVKWLLKRKKVAFMIIKKYKLISINCLAEFLYHMIYDIIRQIWKKFGVNLGRNTPPPLQKRNLEWNWWASELELSELMWNTAYIYGYTSSICVASTLWNSYFYEVDVHFMKVFFPKKNHFKTQCEQFFFYHFVK